MASIATTQWAYPHQAPVIGLSACLTVLAVVVTLLRFLSRRLQHIPLRADDWLTIPAVAAQVGMSAALIVGVAGHGIPSVPSENTLENLGIPPTFSTVPPNLQLGAQVAEASQLLLTLALGFTKLSLLCFYQRIFFFSSSWRSDIYAAVNAGFAAVTALWTVAFFFAQLLECGTNVSALWTPQEQHATCVDLPQLDMAAALSDLVLYVFVLVLPLPRVWALNIHWRQKLAVSAVFLLGILALVASVVRAMAAHQEMSRNASDDSNTTGRISSSSWVLSWSLVEASISAFTASLPTLRFLFSRNGFSAVRDSLHRRSTVTDAENLIDRKDDGASTGGTTRRNSEFWRPDTIVSFETVLRESRIEIQRPKPTIRIPRTPIATQRQHKRRPRSHTNSSGATAFSPVTQMYTPQTPIVSPLTPDISPWTATDSPRIPSYGPLNAIGSPRMPRRTRPFEDWPPVQRRAANTTVGSMKPVPQDTDWQRWLKRKPLPPLNEETTSRTEKKALPSPKRKPLPNAKEAQLPDAAQRIPAMPTHTPLQLEIARDMESAYRGRLGLGLYSNSWFVSRSTTYSVESDRHHGDGAELE